MPTSSGLVVNQRVQLDYDRLARAIHEASTSASHSVSQRLVLAEIRACRAQISHPLDPSAARPPNPSDRARISGLGEITITLSPDSLSDHASAPQEIRIGPDLVSVAFALSDHLQINEFDAAVLLSDARGRAAVRPDRDVVAAAKELAALRRRNAILYLQDLLRAALLSPQKTAHSDDSFIAALIRERDHLVVDHNLLTNLATSLRAAVQPESQQPASPSVRLQPGESVMLAEAIFLISYTVQLSKDEALLIRSLLRDAENSHQALLQRERANSRSSRTFSFSPESPTEQASSAADSITSPHIVDAESVRNLLLLSWMCALDRSRYHDCYDPRTRLSGVNILLKDLSFIPQSCDVPKMESEDDVVSAIPQAIAAAELCAAVFRLAVAEPNEQEAVTTFLRLAAYNHALSFLGDSLTEWISKRAGSLSQDADLYADALEDLSNDIAEAPHILTPMLQFVMQDVQYAAAASAYPTRESAAAAAFPPAGVPSTPGLATTPVTPGGRRARPKSIGTPAPPSPNRRLSMSGPSSRGRPPRPPSNRHSARQSVPDPSRRFSEAVGRPSVAPIGQPVLEEDVKPVQSSSENVLASLARFVARSISLAPSKLSSSTSGGGLRYWTSVGPANWGFMQRIGDAVMDLWDVAMRNPYAPGGVGDAFRQALNGYLELMASTCKKQESPLHAIAALRFLAEGGHSVVSLEQLLRGLSHVNSRLGSIPSQQEAQIDDIDCEVLQGIVNIIALSSDSLRSHGGIMAALGDRGKELSSCVGALAVHSVQPSLKETLIRCLRALGDPRPIVLFLETVGKDRAALLRGYFQNADAMSGDYSVTMEVLGLTSMVTSWSDDEFPDSSVESIVTWFAIEEVLAHWSRRKYVHEAHRWQVVHSACSVIRDMIYRDFTSPRSARALARLLTPAPGTGSASPALKTIVCTAGLSSITEQSSPHPVQNALSSNLLKLSGRSSLVFAAEHGLGDAYRVMQDAVRTSSRLLSILLDVSPGQLALPRMSVVAASEVLDGELPAIRSATTLVYKADSFTPQIMRAGYSVTSCAAVLTMLARAASESTNIANIFSKDPSDGDRSATEFRTALGLIISRSDPHLFANGTDDQGAQKFSLASKDYPDLPLMHSSLALVECCLGRDGSSTPGLFLLGLNVNSSYKYDFASYGVLGALVELVANPNNGDMRIDSLSRAEAATFLDRLASNTVRSTSLAVLEHLRDVCSVDDSVRGGGFADEMLFRIMEEVRAFEPQAMNAEINWNALASTVSSCLSLSALQVRVFSSSERELCLGSRDHRNSFGVDFSSHPDTKEPPSPLELLRVIHTMAGGGDPAAVFDCFKNWYTFVGARLSVHEKGRGYCSVPILFELANAVLEALSQSNPGPSLGSVVSIDGGEIASSVVLMSMEYMQECDGASSTLGDDFVSDVQCGALLNGIIRSFCEVTGVGSNSAKARTALYASLLICAGLAEKRVSEEAIGRALSGTIGQRSGTEVIVGAAAADIISSSNLGTKSAALAALCLVTRVDSAHSVMVLESQNRLRKIVEVCLGNSETKNMISKADLDTQDVGVGMTATKERAAVAVAEACVGLIHAVAGSGHGSRVIAECGCVEALSALFPKVGSRNWNENRRGRLESDMPQDAQMVSEEIASSERMNLLCSLIGAWASAIACAGAAIDIGSIFVVGEGRYFLMELLRSFGSVGGLDELETLSNIGIVMSKLTDEVVLTSEGGASLGGWLASSIGIIVPPSCKGDEFWDDRAKLSIGKGEVEVSNPREARRMGVQHPEGGSLFERDVIQARALCLRNIYAALRGETRVLRLFSPDLEERADGLAFSFTSPAPTSRESARVLGKLSDVLRIVEVMVKEAERMAEEGMRLDSSADGIGGGGGSLPLANIAGYCEEEHGMTDSISARVAGSCLKEAATLSRKHGAVCVTVFESGLFILREFVRAAREVVRGRIASVKHVHGRDGDMKTDILMSVEEAEKLLKESMASLVPLCKHVEGLSDGVWCGKTSSFSKQVCRQIRTSCTPEEVAATPFASRVDSAAATPPFRRGGGAFGLASG